MILDHTAAFPRIVWYFALLALGFANYSFSTVVTSTILLYFLYVFSSFLFYLNILIFLKPFKEQRNYYKTKVLYLLFLPIYNLFAYFVRMAGILNCITRSASWKTDNFTDEKKKFNGIVDKDFDFISRFRKYLKNVFEYPEGETDA
jgi:hypothetical protein